MKKVFTHQTNSCWSVSSGKPDPCAAIYPAACPLCTMSPGETWRPFTVSMDKNSNSYIHRISSLQVISQITPQLKTLANRDDHGVLRLCLSVSSTMVSSTMTGPLPPYNSVVRAIQSGRRRVLCRGVTSASITTTLGGSRLATVYPESTREESLAAMNGRRGGDTTRGPLTALMDTPGTPSSDV
ncbi:hypothetical protein Btru_014254 [Bulinus truncatus]|nr:hypothetical protein Btru_014254 [Bulinus truncatus]